jgi:hypothetical protein
MPGQGRRGPDGSARGTLSLLSFGCPIFIEVSSPEPISVAATALGMDEPGECVDSGAGVRVGVEADAALGADTAPLAGEEGAAEQVGPDCQTVVAPLVALGTDADQGGLIGEQQQLERLGHRVDFRRGHDPPRSVSRGADSQRCDGLPGREK